ncbi:phosphatidylserine decarboxylase [Yunchengibacter salinarum]|uniref:phosphatidylserine decarboxylase n=1 Tax=Yunchengibacter salinarum TaxID=3133399 RepID=UPI0035B667FE
MKASDAVLTPIHREGHLFVALFFVASLVLFMIAEPLGWIGMVATAWCVYFFRDPERVVPRQEGVMVAPADGVVSAVSAAAPPPELDMGSEPVTRISIFLSVFDVHVNRVPAAGSIDKLIYVPGRFLNAADEAASHENERQLVAMTTEDGARIAFAQVAGLVARRILCDLKVDQKVARGERFGLIRFGSRTDIYLAPKQEAMVSEGQTMIGGETVIARMKA